MRAVGVLLLVVPLAGCGGAAPVAVAPADPSIVKAVDGKAVVGNVEVTIESVNISKTEHAIRFRYHNLDKNRIWRHTGPESAKLIDDVGNDYRYKHWYGENLNVQPEEGFKEALGFNPPSKTATQFKLVIAIDTLGGVGRAEFIYPRSDAKTD